MAKKPAKTGLNRCPKCGSTDVALDLKTGKLKCNFCRAIFDAENANEKQDIGQLKGRKVGGGAKDIIPSKKTILTFKCPACGAEVVINADEATSAKCHWCRHIFSLNEQIDNGAVPDIVLPFKLPKDTAEKNIQEFIGARQFYAHPVFKKEFTTENVMGIYLPYMVIDINAHIKFQGTAEHQTRTYTEIEGSGEHRRTVRYYDADAYHVTRESDIMIDDLTIEASSDKLNQDSLVNTTNVINAIMPFDTENCAKWDANYLRGFASEKRDTNIATLDNAVTLQAQDIARCKIKTDTMEFYDRGANWETETIDIKGSEWKATYLPIWLYSYLQDDGKTKLLHYVAVNARNGKTMGSVPIYKAKLFAVSAVIEFFSLIFGGFWMFDWFVDDDAQWYGLAAIAPGFLYYWYITNRYRNASARHYHEKETRSELKNLKKSDKKFESRKRLRNASIEGKNSDDVRGSVAKMNKSGFFKKISEEALEKLKP